MNASVKKILSITCFFIFLSTALQAEFKIEYEPAIQSSQMQYFKPRGDQFAGDCIPFFHDGTYYLYWLLDENHHKALNGLGGHQWALSTSNDLKNWTHHPIALGIDDDWEKSICTGSLVFHKGKFYLFYATRRLSHNKPVEQLSYAIGDNASKFAKQSPNPFYESAPGYSKKNFRDPKVIIEEDGSFCLLISTSIENSTLGGKGCLLRMVSKDLKNWEVKDSILSGLKHVPECPDHFFWNGWYYLVYGQDVRTYYLKSKTPYGPWQYPESQALLEQWTSVVKTAEFTNGRRIAAGWIPSRKDNKDDGRSIFGGNIVLRELVQMQNGDISTKFPKELIPETHKAQKNDIVVACNSEKINANEIEIKAVSSYGAAYIKGIPHNCRITLEIISKGNCEEYGLFLRASSDAKKGYKLAFHQNEQSVSLADSKMFAVRGLGESLKLDIVMKDDIIDVCVDEKRCIINRLPEGKGDCLWFYSKLGNINLKDIKVYPLKD